MPNHARNLRAAAWGYWQEIQIVGKFFSRKALRKIHMKIKAVNTILYCKKWRETIAFYKDGIQLLVLSSNDWFVEFKLNEMSRLSVADETRASIKSGGGKGITISLQVENVVQMMDKLAEAGIQSTPIKQVWGSKAIYVRDPEGNRLEFWEGRAKVERKF